MQKAGLRWHVRFARRADGRRVECRLSGSPFCHLARCACISL